MKTKKAKKEPDVGTEELPDEIVLTEEISGGDRRAYFLRRASDSERRDVIGHLPKEFMEEVAGGDRRAYFLRRASDSERREVIGHLPKDELAGITGGNRRAYFLRRAMGTERREVIGHLPKEELTDVSGGRNYSRTANVTGVTKPHGSDRGMGTPGHLPTRQMEDVVGGQNFNIAGVKKTNPRGLTEPEGGRKPTRS